MPLHHHSLVAWQRADELFVHVHELTRKCFPREELFGLTSQMRRAAYSVAANIVEGFARESPAERLHFLQISAGSLAEVGYCFHVARRLGFIADAAYSCGDIEIRRTSAPLYGLIRQYRSKARHAKTAAVG
jgi:four helix bundle protein